MAYYKFGAKYFNTTYRYFQKQTDKDNIQSYSAAIPTEQTISRDKRILEFGRFLACSG